MVVNVVLSLTLIMFNVNLVIFLMLVIFFPVMMRSQNIFDEVSTVCEYISKDAGKNNQKLEIINKVWSISGTGRNAINTVHFSACGSPLPPTLGCSPKATACLINSRNARKSLLNIGQYFDYTLNADGTKMVLKSLNGQPCDDSSQENYTIIIQFDCQPYSKITPKFLYKDECELHVEMMHPTCTPICSARMNGNLLNFQSLQALGTFTVSEPSNNKFRLGFCKAADACGAGISACELTDGTTKSIGEVAFQQFVIDSKTNDLMIKSHVGTTKRNRLNVEVKLSCNWNVQGISNLKYIVPQIQGRNFKFSGESSLACIKFPQNCIVTDAEDSYLVYNLTTLNRRNGYWKLGNVSNEEEIYLNVCGPLHTPYETTTCSDQYSQVCYLDRRRHFVNLGSIPLDFYATDDIIRATFIDGSVCATNLNSTYRSEIRFSCSQNEKGPILQAIDGCTYIIKWETPAACAKLFATGDNCVLYDITGIINLNEIHKSVDRTYRLSQTSYIRYNLCGPLNQPCNNNSDVGICYVKNNHEYVVGFSNKQLVRDNILLSLKLVGDDCAYRTKSITQVYFNCHHSAPPDGIIRINMVKENCIFDIYIDTPLACPPPVFSKCEVNDGNTFYNLTSLSHNNNNYLVRGSNTNIVYILNVCRSIFNTRDTLCPSDSGACMKNLTEMNIKYKYLSVGRTNISNLPSIENGELIIHYNIGTYCDKGVHHSTTIHFQCHIHEEGPRFLKASSCSHEFLWRTPAACGKHVVKTRDVSCNYSDPVTKQRINLGSVNKMLEIKISNDELYRFSLCEDNYTRCSLNGTKCNVVDTKKRFNLANSNVNQLSYLEYQLHDSYFTKVHIYLICDPLLKSHNFTFYKDDTDQIIKANLSTSLSCVGNEIKLSNEHTQIHDISMINNNRRTKENDGRDLSKENMNNVPINHLNDSTVDQNVIKTETTKKYLFSSSNKSLSISKKLLKEDNCFIKNDKSEAILFLKNIGSFHASSSNGNNYSFRIDEPSPNCNGYICKNDHIFIPRTDKCPHYQFNTMNSSIKLFFTSYETCADTGSVRSEIWLICNSLDKLPHISKESECIVIATYPLKGICSLLESKESIASSTGIAIGSSIGFLILMIFATIVYLSFKRHKQVAYTSIDCTRSPKANKKEVRVYLKDTQL